MLSVDISMRFKVSRSHWAYKKICLKVRWVPRKKREVQCLVLDAFGASGEINQALPRLACLKGYSKTPDYAPLFWNKWLIKMKMASPWNDTRSGNKRGLARLSGVIALLCNSWTSELVETGSGHGGMLNRGTTGKQNGLSRVCVSAVCPYCCSVLLTDQIHILSQEGQINSPQPSDWMDQHHSFIIITSIILPETPHYHNKTAKTSNRCWLLVRPALILKD